MRYFVHISGLSTRAQKVSRLDLSPSRTPAGNYNQIFATRKMQRDTTFFFNGAMNNADTTRCASMRIFRDGEASSRSEGEHLEKEAMIYILIPPLSSPFKTPRIQLSEKQSCAPLNSINQFLLAHVCNGIALRIRSDKSRVHCQTQTVANVDSKRYLLIINSF